MSNSIYAMSIEQQWQALPERERYRLLHGQSNRDAAREIHGKTWDSMDEAEQGFVRRALETQELLVRALTAGIVSPEEYPVAAVEATFSHVSHSPDVGAMVMRNAFLETVQAAYDDAIGSAETQVQRDALMQAIERFKADYLARERSVNGARASSYSGHIAGGSKLNVRQVARRGAALDRASDAFSVWLRQAKDSVKQVVLAARNADQLAAEQQAMDEKAAHKAAREIAMMRRLLNFKQGDDIKFGLYPVAKVSFGRDGYPSSVTVSATDLVDNRFDLAKILFGGSKVRLQAAVDAARAELAAEGAARPRVKAPGMGM